MKPAPKSFEYALPITALQWLNIKHCSFYSRGEEEPDGDEEEIRFVAQQSQLQSLTDLWSRILWNATNGKVSRDVVMGSTPSLDFSYIKLLGLLRPACLECGIKRCCSQSQCYLCYAQDKNPCLQQTNFPICLLSLFFFGSVLPSLSARTLF